MATHNPNIKEALATNLHNARTQADLTQDELAKRTGVHRTVISKIEKAAGQNARFGTIEKLAEGLGCDASSLLGLAVSVNAEPSENSLFIRFVKHAREARKAAGLSQEKLSEMGGFFRTYVGRLETTAKDITIDDANNIASALGLSIEELLLPPP